MAQILVGGDNQDAYSICDALEQQMVNRATSVLFCATPNEVLNNYARGGAAAIVLNFEQAGLTNFELAYRIRETGTAEGVPLLIPEVDALGDVAGALGKNVGTYAFPVQPDVIATLAAKLMDTAAEVAARPAARAAAPVAAGSAKGAPSGRHAGAPEPPKPKLAPPARAAERPSVVSEDAPVQVRSRRVRHRTWDDVRKPRRAPAPPEEEEPQEPEEEDTPPGAAGGKVSGRSVDPKLLGIGIVVLVIALPVFSFYACRASREEAQKVAAAVPKDRLMCSGCDATENHPVTNIHGMRCGRCNKPLGFAFHCIDCKKDFAFVPPATVKTLKSGQAKPECIKCKSWNVKAVPVPGQAPAPSDAKKPAADSTKGKTGKPAKPAPAAEAKD